MLVEKRDAKVEIDIPFLNPPHGSLFRRDCERRTGVFTDAAVLAETIYAVVPRCGQREGRVRQNGGKAKGGAVLG